MHNLGRTTLLAVLLCLPMAGRADTLRLRDGQVVTGQYEGGSSRVVRFRTATGVHEYDVLSVVRVVISEPARGTDQGRGAETPRFVASFGPDQERTIRLWFSDRSNWNDLPPGLAKRDSLPPGLQRQVRKNGTLPPGLQQRLQPLPPELEHRLPRLHEGLGRVILGRDVLLIESASSRVLDLLREVL